MVKAKITDTEVVIATGRQPRKQHRQWLTLLGIQNPAIYPTARD